VLVAPVIVLSTIFLFGTGVALLAVNEVHGTLVGLHKASFVVWLGATAVHVLAHALKLPPLIRARVAGRGLRYGVLAASLVAGVAVAFATLPAADKLQDHATHFVGVDRE
jgi:hypothetical protein